ncbi:MAG: methyltransferase domain-containing protein [Deltaproteobacteria bacterium]|nr:MAG: methyltransferase domain-containing protein [Deltaproteobacteria bacterium]
MMTDQIIGHFAGQANQYDNLMERLVPHYKKQHEIIYELLPESTDKHFYVLDLGCGNGALSELVLKKLPNAKIVGFDLTPKMLEAYEENLSQYRGRYELMLGDYRFESLGNNYDLVLAGLTLQHLTWGERKDFYKLIYNILNPNGSFILNDIIIDEDWDTRKLQYSTWKKFIASNGEDPEFWFDKHMTKDYPVTLEDHFKWLEKAGFSKTDCYWRFHNFAITMAVK